MLELADTTTRSGGGVSIRKTFHRESGSLTTATTLRKLSSYSLYYSFKLFRGITHERKLSKEFLLPFFEAKSLLGNKLLTFLAQFPYSFTPRELPFLKDLISEFTRRGVILTLELRNPSWKEKLKELPVPVACLSFPEGVNWLKGCVKRRELSYYRLHGKGLLYGGNYSQRELKSLASELLSLPSEYKLVFFNNTKGGAPFNALTLLNLLNKGREYKEKERD